MVGVPPGYLRSAPVPAPFSRSLNAASPPQSLHPTGHPYGWYAGGGAIADAAASGYQPPHGNALSLLAAATTPLQFPSGNQTDGAVQAIVTRAMPARETARLITEHSQMVRLVTKSHGRSAKCTALVGREPDRVDFAKNWRFTTVSGAACT